MAQVVRGPDAARAASDDDAQFALEIDAPGDFRVAHRRAVGVQGGGRLEENERLRGRFVAQFPGVLGVVAADTDDFRWRHGRQQPDALKRVGVSVGGANRVAVDFAPENAAIGIRGGDRNQGVE